MKISKNFKDLQKADALELKALAKRNQERWKEAEIFADEMLEALE